MDSINNLKARLVALWLEKIWPFLQTVAAKAGPVLQEAWAKSRPVLEKVSRPIITYFQDELRENKTVAIGRWTLALMALALLIIPQFHWVKVGVEELGLDEVGLADAAKDIRSIWTAFSYQVPFWTIIIPVLAWFTVVLTMWNPRGVFLMSVLLGLLLLPSTIFNIFYMVTLTAENGLEPAGGAVWVVVISFAFTILATVLYVLDEQARKLRQPPVA